MPANSLTYSISADCGTVTVTVAELSVATGLVAVIHDVLNPETPKQYALNVADNAATVTFLTDKDTVFRFQLGSKVGDEPVSEMVSETLFISCRGYKCFNKLNNEEAEDIMAERSGKPAEWKAAYALLRSATAAYRTGNLTLSARLLALLEEACKQFNCHCGC